MNIKKVTLGTAQLGMPGYGIANRSKLAKKEARQLVRDAIALGITSFDTARAYGAAEEVLGSALGNIDEGVSVITKLVPLDEYHRLSDISAVRQQVDNSISASRTALRSKRLPIVMLHRWRDRTLCNGEAWDRLCYWKRVGIIKELGASISTPREALEATLLPEIQHLQIPVNLLDYRWDNEDFQEGLKRRPDIKIYARSILLQGVMALPPEAWPVIPARQATEVCSVLDDFVVQLGLRNRVELAIVFAKSLTYIHQTVIGVDSLEQLHVLAELSSRSAQVGSQINDLRDSLPRLPENFLNPAKWQ